MLSVAPEGRGHWTTVTEFKEGYKAQSLPPFGKSNHAAVFLMPRYRQKLKSEPPAMREIQPWSESLLQDALVEDVVPKVTIKTYPHQKPWVNHSIREALYSRTAAYNLGLVSGNMEEYKSKENG